MTIPIGLEVARSGFYIQQLGQEFTLDVSDVPLKSLLDQVIKESPVVLHTHNPAFIGRMNVV